MLEKKSQNYTPDEKVERMNRVFDHVVLPIVIFTIVMLVVSSFIFRPESCLGKTDISQSAADSAQNPDAFVLREVLLEDLELNRSIFERGGYIVVETEQSGIVAYCQLDEHTEVFEGIADSSGRVYSVISYENEGLTVNIRIYSKNIFLVDATDIERSASAIFRDETFGSWTSGSDADAAGILEIISAQELSGLIEQYKAKIISLVRD